MKVKNVFRVGQTSFWIWSFYGINSKKDMHLYLKNENKALFLSTQIVKVKNTLPFHVRLMFCIQSEE